MPTNRTTWSTGSWTRTPTNSRSSSGSRTNYGARSSYGTRSTRSTSSSTYSTANMPTYSSSRFTTCRNEISQRICSYRTLNEQISGNSNVTAFSPTVANRWIRFVDNGSLVYKFTNTELCRCCGPQFSSVSPTMAFRIMRKRFGAGIKAVTRGRNNTWLVAATTNVTARPFSNYNWK